MRSFYKVAQCLALLFVIAGCQEEDALSEQIANAKHFELNLAQPAELIKDQGFSIGSYKTVNNMGDVAVDEEGNLYVINAHRKRIEVFDSDGDHIKTVGSVGSDPGDFQYPTYLNVQGDSLYVYDQTLFRMYRYRLPELELSTVTYLENTAEGSGVDSLSYAMPFLTEVLSNGNYLIGFQIVESPDDRLLLFYEVNPEGEIVSDQLLAFKNKSLYVDEAVNPPLIMMLPYEPEILTVTDSQNRLYSTNTDHFLIKVMDSAGKEIEARYFPFEKHNLVRSDLIELYTDPHLRRAMRRARLPGKWPAVAEIKIDDQDRLWVATIISDLDKYQWYVLEPSGKPIATFDLSRNKKIMAIRGEYIYIKAYNTAKYSDQVFRSILNF